MRIKLHNRTIDTNGDYRVYNLKEFDTIVNKVLECKKIGQPTYLQIVATPFDFRMLSKT